MDEAADDAYPAPSSGNRLTFVSSTWMPIGVFPTLVRARNGSKSKQKLLQIFQIGSQNESKTSAVFGSHQPLKNIETGQKQRPQYGHLFRQITGSGYVQFLNVIDPIWHPKCVPTFCCMSTSDMTSRQYMRPAATPHRFRQRLHHCFCPFFVFATR